VFTKVVSLVLCGIVGKCYFDILNHNQQIRYTVHNKLYYMENKQESTQLSILMVINTTFSNISVILIRSVLLVEETGVPRENHQSVTSY